MTDLRTDRGDGAHVPGALRAAERPAGEDRSLGQMLSDLSGDFGQLVHDEIELAKLEMREELKKAGKGGGMLGVGAMAGYLTILLLSFAAAWALDTVMPTGWAFFIVAVLWGIAAAVLALMGRQELRGVDPVPHQTKRTLEEDARWARQLKS